MACLGEETLTAASEGRIDAAVRDQLFEHLDDCSACRRVLSHLCAARFERDALASTLGDALQTDERALDTGSRVGRYVILGIAGSGAMGRVYRAYDPQLDRTVAIKLPRIAVRGDASTRFLREARAQALLSHPNIVSIFDVGIAEDRLFIVMDWVVGQTARAWLAARPRSTAEILATYSAIGRALGAAHRAGLIHQDVKPDNVLIGSDGHPQITDFGLARRSDVERSNARTLEGTPLYMSPEQLRGEPSTAHSDQFGFCVALWEGLFDARPFEASTEAGLLEAILRGPVAVDRTRVPRHVFAALRRGLSVRAEDRFATMEALVAALERSRGSRMSRMAALAFALAGCAAIWNVATDHSVAMPAHAEVPAVPPAPPTPTKNIDAPATPSARTTPSESRADGHRAEMRHHPAPGSPRTKRTDAPPTAAKLDDGLIDPLAGEPTR